jgi:hypothetical protein
MRKLLLTLLSLGVAFSSIQAQVFLEEDFDACSLPAGWDNSPTDSTFVWEFTDASSDPGNVGNLDGTCMALFDDDALGSTAANVGARLTSPPIDATGASGTVLLEYDYNYRALGSSTFVVEVFNGSTFTFDTVQVLSTVDDCGAWTCGPPYPRASIDITAQAMASPFMSIRFSYNDGGSFAWYAGVDNISVRGLLSQDAGVSSVLTPNADGCGDPAAEVSCVVTNFGFDTIPNIVMRLQVDGGALISESFSSVSLAPGADTTYTFTATADLSALGPHTVTCIASALSGDAEPANDDESVIVNTLAPVAFPVIEDFDSYAAATTDFLNFSDGGGELSFQTDAGGTTSSNTGPSDDVSGGGNYIYMETSGSSYGDRAILVSDCIDITGTNPTLQFYYHMHGAAIDYLATDLIQADGVVISLDSLIGEQTADELDPFQLQSISLLSYVGQTVQFRWTGASTDAFGGSTFQADIAIDEISISDLLNNDVGVTELVAPGDDCGLGAAETVTVEVTNFGLDTAFGANMTLTVGGSLIATESLVDTIAPGASVEYTFAATADLSTLGPNTVDASASALPSDDNPGNDVLNAIVTNVIPITAFPYTTDFEQWSVCGTTCGTVCVAEEGWVNDSDDDADWLTDEGGTGSSGTGPAVDNTVGTSIGNYLYTEASGCSFDTSRITSPCFDITGLGIPGIEFFYHMFGDQQGTLSVEVTDDNGATWTEIYSRTGQDQTADTDPWVRVQVPFTGFSGVLKVRIVGVRGSDFESDMAIDDVSILDLPATGDGGVVEVFPSGAVCDPGATAPVTVTIQNFGIVDISGFDVNYQLDGGAVVTENVGALNIVSGGTDVYTFAATVDLSVDTTYSIVAWTSITGDADASNDTAAASIENQTSISTYPDVETFDSEVLCGNTLFACNPDGSCVLAGTWQNISGDDIDWSVDNLGTGSGGTGPSDDVTGGGNYLFTESSSCGGSSAILESGCYDLSALSNPYFDLSYHMYGFGMSTATLTALATADDGLTWDTIYTRTGQDQLDELDPFQLVETSLIAYLGQTIKLRVVGTTGGATSSDIGLDQLRVYERSAIDGEALAMGPSGSDCELSATTSISIDVVNKGIAPLTGFDAAYSIDGGADVVENVGAFSVAPADTATYVFATTVDLSADGTYSIDGYIVVTGDGDATNDTAATATITNEVAEVLPLLEDFDSYGLSVEVFDNWSNTELGTPDWSTDNNATGSTDTGPDFDASGVGTYSYVEASGSDSGDVAILESDCIDLTAATNPRLTYAYHMYGNSIDRMEVVADIGGVENILRTWTGEQQDSTSDAWKRDTLSLAAAVGQTIRLRFKGFIGVDTNGFTFNADMAIDEVFVDDPTPNDVGTVELVSPTDGCLGDAEVVSAAVQNFGLDPTSTIQMSLTVDGVGPITELWSVVIAPGEVDTFTFAATADLSGAGDYAITVGANVLGDGNPLNNDLTDTVFNSVIAPGFVDNFDSLDNGLTTFDNAVNLGPDIDWQVDDLGTSSTGTGPSADASGTGKYIYMETSSPVDSGDVATLSYCVDLTSSTDVDLSYAYHMFGGSIVSLRVDIVGPFSTFTAAEYLGQQQDSSDAAWLRDTIDISAFAGSVIEVQFIGTTGVDTASGFTFLADIALDEIAIDETVAPGCSTASPPMNPMSTDLGTSVALSWDAVPESVGCRVNGTRVSPPGPSGSANVLGFEVTSTVVPYALIQDTIPTIWEFSVICACSISPLATTPPSATDTFIVPASSPRLLELNLEDLKLYPNPADQEVFVSFDTDLVGEYTLQVVDLLGRVVETRTVTFVEGYNNIRFAAANYAEGLYFIQMDEQLLGSFEVAHP